MVDATMIALFACRKLEQNGNEGAIPTTKDHGRRDDLSPTMAGSITIYSILLTSAYRN